MQVVSFTLGPHQVTLRLPCWCLVRLSKTLHQRFISFQPQPHRNFLRFSAPGSCAHKRAPHHALDGVMIEDDATDDDSNEL